MEMLTHAELNRDLLNRWPVTVLKSTLPQNIEAPFHRPNMTRCSSPVAIRCAYQVSRRCEDISGQSVVDSSLFKLEPRPRRTFFFLDELNEAISKDNA